MNKKLIKELIRLNPQFHLNKQLFHVLPEDYEFYGKDTDSELLDRVNTGFGKDNYTSEDSLLFKYQTMKILIKSDDDITFINYVIVVNIADLSKYNEGWESELFGTATDGNYLGTIKFNNIFFSNYRFKNSLDYIECNGSKCRLGSWNGNIWCESCSGSMNCNKLDNFMKKTLAFSTIPLESILHVEKKELKLDWDNKNHLRDFYAFVTNGISYIESLTNKIISGNKKIDDLKQSITDEKVLMEFITDPHNEKLDITDLLRRRFPRTNIELAKENLEKLQTENKDITNELNHFINTNYSIDKLKHFENLLYPKLYAR